MKHTLFRSIDRVFVFVGPTYYEYLFKNYLTGNRFHVNARGRSSSRCCYVFVYCQRRKRTFSIDVVVLDFRLHIKWWMRESLCPSAKKKKTNNTQKRFRTRRKSSGRVGVHNKYRVLCSICRWVFACCWLTCPN